MKKVLSLVLVAVLALGMGVTAFANDLTIVYDNIKSFADGRNLTSGIEGISDQEVSLQHYDWGTVHPKDKPKLDIYLWTWMFGDYSFETTTSTNVYTPDLDKMYDRGIITTTSVNTWGEFHQALGGIVSYEDIYSPWNWYRKTGERYATESDKAHAFARSFINSGYVKVVDENDAGNLTFFSRFDPDIANNPAAPGDNAYLVSSAKIYAETTRNNANRLLTSNEITKSKLTVGHSVTGDANLIKKIELQRSEGRIRMETVTEWASTSGKDIEVNIYLSIDGKRQDTKGVRVDFELKNPEIEVWGSHNYVDLSDGYVAVAEEFNSSITVDMGEGVSMLTKMFKGKKYYGMAKRVADEEDERVFKQYKEVDNVINLSVVGLNSVGDIIRLSTDYSGYFVYDKDLNYLGKADEDLKFSNKLYLAYEKLEIEEDEEEYEEEAPVPTTPENPETGGNGNAANNVNLNPGTGR